MLETELGQAILFGFVVALFVFFGLLEALDVRDRYRTRRQILERVWPKGAK